MEYIEFLQTKAKKVIESGFEVNENDLNVNLFDFQKFAVKRALKKGKFALFFDCGLGKSLCSLSWSDQVVKYTNKPVLIVCPLAVSGQFVQEGSKFNISVQKVSSGSEITENKIYVTNYEKLEKFDCSVFGGVVIDESSILKNYSGATKQLIIDSFANTEFKLACTATPSPNDHLELGNTAEFLNICNQKEMISIFFINDVFGKDVKNKWRLKKHSIKAFWQWVSSWSLMASNPSDLGFDGDKYILPDLNMVEYRIDVPKQDNGMLINNDSVSATEFYRELKLTINERCNYVANEVNSSSESFIIWCKSSEEAKLLNKLIPDSVEVSGSDKPEVKEKNLLGFANNEFRVLITKTKIASFGLNYQNCNNQIFCSFDFSFESLYQGIRRSYRFGQTKQVNIKLITVETMGNVIEAINNKKEKFKDMQREMQSAMNIATENSINLENNIKEVSNDRYNLINSDSTEYIKTMEEDSVDYTFFSPPFSDLYMFSDDIRDLSNNKNYEEFFKHFDFLVPELLRITKPGRLLSMHCTQLSTTMGKDGRLEIIDFRGDLIRLFKKHGFVFHAEVAIYKDPKVIAQRTHNMQLLHGTTKKDSTISRMAFPDYILTFKKVGENLEPVNHNKNGIPFSLWCKIAEPIWLDVNASNVLKVKDSKSEKDEKHMTPTQLQPIEWLYMLYTNPNDLVFSPFSGIGSEGYQAIKMKRRFKGIELKKSYFDVSVKNLNCAIAEGEQLTLLDLLAV